jgi:hypothetical protein
MKFDWGLRATVEALENEAGVDGPVLEARCQINDGEITADKFEAVIRFSSSNQVTLFK